MNIRNTPESFWRKVNQGVPNECWPWRASCKVDGYGQITYQGQPWRAHRLAYVLTNGPIPAGLVVMHLCDNRSCCNPLHLSIGTVVGNNADMRAKGRQRGAPGDKNGSCLHPESRPRGENHCRSKLREQDVLQMKQMRLFGNTYKTIARYFDVHLATAHRAVTGRRWRHLMLSGTAEQANGQ